jgi:hypothetical protein
MLEYWKNCIPTMSTEALFFLATDAEMRIGSHVAGCNPLTEYVQRQIALLELLQVELEKR